MDLTPILFSIFKNDDYLKNEVLQNEQNKKVIFSIFKKILIKS